MRTIIVFLMFLLFAGCEVFDDNISGPKPPEQLTTSNMVLKINHNGLGKVSAGSYWFQTNAVLNSDSSGTKVDTFTFSESVSFRTVVTEDAPYYGKLMNGADAVFSGFTFGNEQPTHYTINPNEGIKFHYGVGINGNLYQEVDNLSDTVDVPIRVYGNGFGHFEFNGSATNFQNKNMSYIEPGDAQGYYEATLKTLIGVQKLDIWGYGAAYDSVTIGNVVIYDIENGYINLHVYPNEVEVLDSLNQYYDRVSVTNSSYESVKIFFQTENSTGIDSLNLHLSGNRWLRDYTFPMNESIALRAVADTEVVFNNVKIGAQELHHLVADDDNNYWFVFELNSDYKVKQEEDNRYPIVGTGG